MIILIIFIFNITSFAQLLTLGHKQNDKQHESITIENLPNQLNIRFCAFHDVPPLTTNQFNYPNIQEFIPLNKQVLATLITYQRIIELVNQAALLHYQNARCKQLALFDYKLDSFNHEQIVIMHNIVHILKQEYPEIEKLFKQNQFWEFNMKLYSQKPHYISLEFLKQSHTYIQPYKMNKKLQEQGLHQYLQTKIEFADHIDLENQDIIIQDYLDIYSYLDKDEMDKMEFQVQLMTIIDIEKPQNLSPQHIVFYKMKFNKTITYTQPYHFRYHLATNDSYATSYVPTNPIIYFNNKSYTIGEDDIFGQIIRNNFNQEHYQKLEQWSRIEHLEYQVPTGYLPSKHVVFLITIGVTLGMAIHIGKQIMRCKI